METILNRVKKEQKFYLTADSAAIDHLKMAYGHLFEKTEKQNTENILTDINKILKKLNNIIK